MAPQIQALPEVTKAVLPLGFSNFLHLCGMAELSSNDYATDKPDDVL